VVFIPSTLAGRGAAEKQKVTPAAGESAPSGGEKITQPFAVRAGNEREP
jgi:hypothetical protein